jgi:LPS export ABC transporter protein LptC
LVIVLLGIKKNKKLRFIVLAVILVTVGTVVSVFIGYQKVSNVPELLLDSIKDGANLSLGKIRQTATRNGIKEWSLEAGSALYIENEKKAVLKNLFITYYLKDRSEVYIEAEQGILQTDTNDIEVSGNVVVRNESYQLKTRRLTYEHERRLIISNDPVHISGDDVELSAATLKYDLDANKIVLRGNVEAAISKDFEAIQNVGTGRQQ